MKQKENKRPLLTERGLPKETLDKALSAIARQLKKNRDQEAVKKEQKT